MKKISRVKKIPLYITLTVHFLDTKIIIISLFCSPIIQYNKLAECFLEKLCLLHDSYSGWFTEITISNKESILWTTL